MDIETLTRNTAIALLVIILGYLIATLVGWLILRRQSRKPIEIGGYPLQFELWRGPLRATIPALLLRLVATWFLGYPDTISSPLIHFLDLWIIASIAWHAKRSVQMIRSAIVDRFPIDVEDNLEARRVRTQTRVLVRIANVTIITLAVALMLVTFPGVREFGASILVSAGFAAIVVGMAAQKSLGSVFAGIQLAISQPIRLDDVVIVEGEWGRVEEITLTYVVVSIWDQRRLVVPISYFIDNPFQNWTKTTAEILGTVFVYADYSIPVGVVRDKLKEILDDTALWDGRAWGMVVTDATERTIELRALMSAKNSSDVWNLRCHVREQLIAFLQEQFPDNLPRLRLEGQPASQT